MAKVIPIKRKNNNVVCIRRDDPRGPQPPATAMPRPAVPINTAAISNRTVTVIPLGVPEHRAA